MLQKDDPNKVYYSTPVSIFMCTFFLKSYMASQINVSVSCCPFILTFKTDINDFIYKNICVNSADTEISMQ